MYSIFCEINSEISQGSHAICYTFLSTFDKLQAKCPLTFPSLPPL